MLVAIAGASCSGKTTTARLLAAQTGMLFSAGDEHNEPELTSGELHVANHHGDLVVERWFLDLHRRRLTELDLTGPVVCDWSLASDLAYARALLSGAKLARFETLYARATDGLPAPDVWVVLAADPALLAARKAARRTTDRRVDDEPMPDGWLERIQAAHVELARTLPGGLVIDLAADDTPGQVAGRVAERLQPAAA